LKLEADEIDETVNRIQENVLDLPSDAEWTAFVENDKAFIDPKISMRNYEDITYPGFDHPGASEVRSGMLERKSKYLKSYTPGW
jgi:hypothetical protein